MLARIIIAILFIVSSVNITFAETNKVYDPYVDSRWPKEINGKWGYRDAYDRIAITPQFEQAGEFEGDTARVKYSGKFGTIDRSGSFVLKPIYSRILPFIDKTYKVELNGKYGLIGENGIYKLDPKYDSIEAYYQGLVLVKLVLVKIDNKSGLFDIKSGMVVKPIYDQLTYLHNRIWLAELAGKWGLIDNLGNVIIKPKFEEITDSYYEGLLRFKSNNKWGLLDDQGNVVSDAKLLLKNKTNINDLQNDGLTPLMFAANNGIVEAAALLVKAGADVNLSDEKGNTPLMMAAEGGYLEIVKLLIDRKANLHTEGEFGKTALTIATTMGHTEVVELLLRAGANPDLQMGARSGIGGTALHLAAKYGHRDAAALLLKYKADINARDRDGGTPLIRAADSYDEEYEDGELNVAELLISKGADINAVNKLGMTALIFASMRGFDKMAELLINKGADINIKDSYKTPAIHNASQGCNANIVAKLIRASTQPDTRLYTSLLMSAAERCHDSKILEVLLDAQADVNAQDEFGRTPLVITNIAGRTHNADFLRSRGGRIGKPASKGLEIVSPNPGDTFLEGDTVKLIVKVSAGTPKLNFVGLDEELFGTESHCRRELIGDRYICKYVIPVDSGPWTMIGISGIIADKGIVSHSVPIAVKMPPGIKLSELKVSTNNSDGKIFLVGLKNSEQLYVQGVYSDGVKRKIVNSASGTTYESSNPLIAKVDSEGRVSPVAPGKTEIVVRNNGKSGIVPVIINIKSYRNVDLHRKVAHKSKIMDPER